MHLNFKHIAFGMCLSQVHFYLVQQIVKETIGVGVNEKAVLRFYQTTGGCGQNSGLL